MRSFAVIPAAGRSRRMGRPKLLLPWGAGTVIQSVLQAWTSSRVTRVVVVLRGDDDDLLARCRMFDVDLVPAPQDPPDMKASVRLALDHVRQHYRPGNSDCWLLAPADMPRLSAALINRLLEASQAAEPDRILVPVCGGRRGHPVLFPWRFADQVAQLGVDEGINALRSETNTTTVPVSDGTILDDLDTPEDFRRLRARKI